jgi:hypothetical protein
MSEHAWDGSFTEHKRWMLDPVLIIECANEAQVHMRNYGAVAGVPFMVESIELWRVDDEGLVASVRAFWEVPTDPALLDHLALSRLEGATTLD